MAPKIADLEEFVKKWAWDIFHKTRSKEHSRLRYEDVRLEVNWSRVKFISSQPQYSDSRMIDRPQSQVVFRSTYENLTDHFQDHSFQTDRTTTSCCITSVTKGFTKGMHLELKLGLPDDVASATAGFGREVNMESTDETVKEETMNWSINSTIKVPGHHCTVAELVVNEKEYNASFKMSVQVRGVVIVVITNLRDNNAFVQSVEGDISEVIKNEKNKDANVTIENRTATWEVEGTCHFRFGVEQHVRLQESPIGQAGN